MNRVLISHFYNEEYLLPHWLKHHKQYFEHGVLINYASTDNSVEIIKSICPTWEIRNSRNPEFHATAVDAEVMDIEKEFPDMWKIVLNTTEFLVCGDLDEKIKLTEAQNISAIRLSSATIVDKDRCYDDNILNKTYGHYDDWTRCRLMHKHACGNYNPGRHTWSHPHNQVHDMYVMFFGYAPWTEETIARKLQIQNRISASDKAMGAGVQHITNRDKLESTWKSNLDKSHDLLSDEQFKIAWTETPKY